MVHRRLCRRAKEVSMTGENAKARSKFRRIQAAAIAAAALGATSASWGQIASLNKGQQLLVNQGLQVFGLTNDTQYPVHYNQGGYNSVAATNLTGLQWSYSPHPELGQPATDMSVLGAAPGATWGKWADYLGTPSTALN